MCHLPFSIPTDSNAIRRHRNGIIESFSLRMSDKVITFMPSHYRHTINRNPNRRRLHQFKSYGNMAKAEPFHLCISTRICIVYWVKSALPSIGWLHMPSISRQRFHEFFSFFQFRIAHSQMVAFIFPNHRDNHESRSCHRYGYAQSTSATYFDCAQPRDGRR